MRNTKQDYDQSVDLVDRINDYLTKLTVENLDNLILEIRPCDVSIIRDWNQKALKYDHEQEMKERYIKDLNSPHKIIVGQDNEERTTALKIIGLIESLKTRSRSQIDEVLEQLIRIIKMTFVDYDKEKLIEIDQYGKVGVVEYEK